MIPPLALVESERVSTEAADRDDEDCDCSLSKCLLWPGEGWREERDGGRKAEFIVIASPLSHLHQNARAPTPTELGGRRPHRTGKVPGVNPLPTNKSLKGKEGKDPHFHKSSGRPNSFNTLK